MVTEGRYYLFMTLSYFFSGRVVNLSGGHVVLTDARVHYEDIGDLGAFRGSSAKMSVLALGVIVPLSGTTILAYSPSEA